jgi:LuxR family transcriptional regulator, maltose regulon positive regulatory protein
MPPKLLATKFHQPAPAPRWMKRPRLVERLNEGLLLGRPLTLVSAPAGFGKTSCVAEWLSQVDLPVAWLSLDASDNDPARFFAYFIAALQRIDEHLGQEIASALDSGQVLPAETIAVTLLNDLLGAEQRFILALDDFHLIQDAGILQVLERLAAGRLGSPLTPMHLLMVTREDPLLPLARLRANDQLTEIRAGDLRFTGEEATGFLNELMGLSLSTSDVTALEERTEGWVVGLQLAGLSMRGRPDPSSFIATLSGSHRYILSYLAEEVLSRQPEEIQAFLLQSAILDSLTGELCDAVTGRSGSAELLERLYNANLFLIPLDDEQRWYRYHHLFAGLLRSQLGVRSPAQLVAQLHQRASRWYAAAGQPGEAIEHALAAADFPAALGLIEQHVMSILTQGYGRTVEGWLQAIPAELRQRSVRTNLAFAWMHLLRGSYAQIPPYLKQVEEALALDENGGDSAAFGSDSDTLRAEWLALQANLVNVQGRAGEGVELARKALELAPANDVYLKCLAYLGMGGSFRILGDYASLSEAYQKAIQYSREAGILLAEMMAVSALMLMSIRHGQLHFARQVGMQAVDRFERNGKPPPPIAASVYGVLGIVQYLWNQLEPAYVLFNRALQMSVLVGHNAGIVFTRVLMSKLSMAEGNVAAAYTLAEEAASLLAQGVPAWLKPYVADQQVRMLLAQAEPGSSGAEAEAALKQYTAVPEEAQPPFELYALAALRIRLHRARALPGAMELANRQVETAVQAGRGGITLQALLLRARLHAGMAHEIGLPGREDLLSQARLMAQAKADLEAALALAEPQANLRAFLDEGPAIAALLRCGLPDTPHTAFVRQILAGFGEGEYAEEAGAFQAAPGSSEPAVSPNAEALPEPLTDRELDVLRLMADGLKYEEIAEKLVISLNTVRFYVKQVYGKLGVNNRTRAIEAARKAGVL